MSLSVNFLNLKLKNPIIVAAGPWSRDAESIQRSIDAGAGAVVTETIALETGMNIRPRLFKEEEHLYNITLYSLLGLEQWELEFDKIDKKDSFLICSIWGSSPSEISYIASRVERMGADAIEISMSAPIGSKSERMSHYPSYIGEFVKATVDVVNIPVMVKLSYNTSLYTDIVRSIEKAGATAISAIDSLKALQGVDIEEKKSIMPTFGGYTGQHLRPVSLATMATLAQTSSIELSGMGGIFNHKNALEYIMLGASTVQMASAIMLEGEEVISKTVSDLEQWMKEKDITDIKSLRGSALKSLSTYQDIPVKNYVSQVREDYNLDACVQCIEAKVSCMYGAIKIEDNKAMVIEEKCTGCGICVEICPKCFHLVWI